MSTHKLENINWVIPDGMSRKRFGLVLCKYDPKDLTQATSTVAGTFDLLEEAQREASRRFAEFRPGLAMIQDTEPGGKLICAQNWNHDCLTWAEFKSKS